MKAKLLVIVGTISVIVFLIATMYSAKKATKEGLDTNPNSNSSNSEKMRFASFIRSIEDKDKNTTKIIDTSNNKYSQDLKNIMDIQYHASDKELMKQNDGMDVSFGSTWIYDMSGNKVAYPSTKIQGDIVYYTPGAYSFGTSSYVPNYEDSIALSKTTGMSISTPFHSETESTGFCNYHKNTPDKIEQSCRKLNKDTCATTDCCVLLGGSTCIAGNQFGPTQKSNYSDVFIRNKDYYYYRGKCYGNCK